MVPGRPRPRPRRDPVRHGGRGGRLGRSRWSPRSSRSRFIALNLANGPFPGVAAEIRGSAVVRTLDAALPQPPSLLAQVRRLFNRFGFPDVFSGIPPLPADCGPAASVAKAEVEAAASSTVQVIGPGAM